MKTNWEAWNDGVRHQIHLSANYVTVSEGAGFTELGSEHTHEEFLASQQLQHGIAVAHGPSVLAEVIAAVGAAGSYLPFVEKLSTERDHLARFKAIPLDDSLPALLSDSSHGVYRNGANGETIVRSDTTTLTMEGEGPNGFLRPNDLESPRRALRLGSISRIVAWKDMFCILLGGNFVLVDAEGGVEQFPVDHQIKLGHSLRLNDCFRHPDAWLFSYWWLGVPLPRGLFRYEHGKGLTGRWEGSANHR
jgi:hypothetical protein